MKALISSEVSQEAKAECYESKTESGFAVV